MAKPGLTIHRLELFLAVLDRGGIARAAVAKNISQPAVSEHLRGLEEHFGVALFDRAGRSIRPTAAARALEPYARQALDLLRSAERAANDLRRMRAGTLTLGASSTPGTYLLPTRLGAFRQEHPAVSMSLRIGNTRDVEAWVASGEVELGVVGETVVTEGLATDPWIDDQLVLIVPAKHSLARRRGASAAVLAKEPWIARERGSSTRRFTERVLSEAGLTVTPAMELGSTEAVRQAVAAGLGLAVVSRHAVPAGDKRTITLTIDGGWRRRLMVLRRLTAPLAPMASRFRADLLRSDSPKTLSVA